MKFRVVYTDEASSFLEALPAKVRNKIFYNVQKVSQGVMDKELFKKLEESEIWEFRTLFNGNYYRLLAFWDTSTETLVVATNGFLKKTKKTPVKKIQRAETIRMEYFNLKKQNKL